MNSNMSKSLGRIIFAKILWSPIPFSLRKKIILFDNPLIDFEPEDIIKCIMPSRIFSWLNHEILTLWNSYLQPAIWRKMPENMWHSICCGYWRGLDIGIEKLMREKDVSCEEQEFYFQNSISSTPFDMEMYNLIKTHQETYATPFLLFPVESRTSWDSHMYQHIYYLNFVSNSVRDDIKLPFIRHFTSNIVRDDNKLMGLLQNIYQFITRYSSLLVQVRYLVPYCLASCFQSRTIIVESDKYLGIEAQFSSYCIQIAEEIENGDIPKWVYPEDNEIEIYKDKSATLDSAEDLILMTTKLYSDSVKESEIFAFTAYKRVDQKITPVSGMFPEEAQVH